MKKYAKIRCYQTNAKVWTEEPGKYTLVSIVWDGKEWDDDAEWNKWADEELAPIMDYDNYEEIKTRLRIHTDHLVGDGDTEVEEHTYDVVFNDDTASNSMGWEVSEQYCRDYIERCNGTNDGYFEDYKGSIVSIVCNETEEEVFETEVK